jgi:hypothetical protein
MSSLEIASSGVRMVESGPFFEVWQSPSGATSRLDWNRRGVARICVTGHGHVDFSPPAIRRWDGTLRMADRPVILIDFWDMPTYDSGMRLQMTPWGAKHRQNVDFHVCTRSRLVLMGLAVANIAMGGLMKVHEKRAEFDAFCITHGLPARTTK